MLHKLKGKFLDIVRYHDYEDIASFIGKVTNTYRQGILRLQILPDNEPYVIVAYLLPASPRNNALAVIYDLSRESLVSNISIDVLKKYLKTSGNVEAYLLGEEEFEVDREVINFRATLDYSSNYLITFGIDELLPQIPLHSESSAGKSGGGVGEARPKSSPTSHSSPPSAGISSSLYSMISDMLSEELSEILSDPVFMASVLMSSENPVVRKVRVEDAASLVADMIQSSRNRVLSCMLGDRLLYHIYINGFGRVGFCATTEEGIKICGRDALNFLKKVEDNMRNIHTDNYATVITYDLRPERSHI